MDRRSHFYSVALALLLMLAGSAAALAAPLAPPLAPRPVGDPVPPLDFKDVADAPGDLPLWREDPARVSDGTRLQMEPEAYMKALDALGLSDHLRNRALRPADKATGAWERMGPVGGFGTPRRNGRIAGLQLVPASGFYRIYAGSCQGGLWWTGALTFGQWTEVGRNLPNPSVRAFWVDPENLSHIIVGTGDYRRYFGAGMFSTLDEGLTWTKVPLPVSTPYYFYRILDLGLDSGTGLHRLLAVSDYGPLHSDDSGATWSRGLTPTGSVISANFTDVVASSTVPGRLYAPRCDAIPGGVSGIWTSADYGATWSQQAVPNFPAPELWERASLAISPSNPSVMAVIIFGSGKLQGVFRTVNGGTSWSNVTNNLVGTSGSFGGNQLFHAQAITIDPIDPNRMYFGGITIATTTDGGATWNIGATATGISIGHSDITQLHFDPLSGNDLLWICNDGGIYYHVLSTGLTYDGLGDSSTGLACSEVDYLDVEREGVAIGMQDNGTLTSWNGGQTWNFIEGGDGGDVEIFDPIKGHIFFNNGVNSPAPPWRTWRLWFGGTKEDTFAPDVYMPRLHYSPFSDRIYTFDSTGLYSLAPRGALVWNLQTANWQGTPYRTRNMFSAWGRDKAFWFTYWTDSRTTNNGDEDLTYVYDQGGAWQVKHWENFNPSNDEVMLVAPSREWPDEAWVGVNGIFGDPKIFHLRNGGDVVEDITGSLSSANYVSAIATMPFNPDVVWAGTDVGVFQTTDGGLTWTPFMDGLPIGRCSELHFDVDHTHSGTHYLYLALDGRGVWRRAITMPPIYYVDASVTASGDGTVWGTPFKTVGEALAVASPGGIIAVRADSYLEPQRMSNNVRIVTWQGSSRVH